jgi:TPR repeat protein
MRSSFALCLVAILSAGVACSATTTSKPTPQAQAAPVASATWPTESECDGFNNAIAERTGGVSRELIQKLGEACTRIACACFPAGMAYRDGVGVPENIRAAFVLFDQGCTQENWASCSEAGSLCEGKSGLPADLGKMRLYLERGCEHEPWICQNLAFIYVDGLGVSPDYAKAEALMRRACDDWAPGCITLGNFLLHRASKPQEAERIFALACQRDDSLCDRSWPD